jgi:putative tricarboxylic transport membrane protein
MMLATAPIADWAISAFGPPEIFALVFFGLAVAASVGAKTFWKGWLSILIGLMVAVVGLDPVGGIERYDFEMPYLLAGIHFIPTILGFFAVSEIFVQAEKKAKGSYTAPKLSVNFPSLTELIAHKWAVIRSIVIGFFCGILPGIGATLAAFMGYNEAVRWSKTPEEFGKGKLEGVISSETANNAATGAAMIPLLALGLPGGALTAMMVGVFQMHDMEPGPLVFLNSADLVWVVFAAMFFANVSILFVGFLETKTIINLLRIPFQFWTDHRCHRHVSRRSDWILPAPFGILGSGYRARPDSWQDRRADLCPGHANAALRVEWLFRSPDCLRTFGGRRNYLVG